MTKFKERSMKKNWRLLTSRYKLFAEMCVAVLISLEASFKIQFM